MILGEGKVLEKTAKTRGLCGAYKIQKQVRYTCEAGGGKIAGGKSWQICEKSRTLRRLYYTEAEMTPVVLSKSIDRVFLLRLSVRGLLLPACESIVSAMTSST